MDYTEQAIHRWTRAHAAEENGVWPEGSVNVIADDSTVVRAAGQGES